MRIIENVFIHCTGGNQDATPEDLMKVFKERGWKNPGYHYIIDKKGVTHQLLDIAEIANGIAGHNANSIHIAWVGGLGADNRTPVDNRTPEQKKTLGAWISFFHRMGFMVMGHREIWGRNPKNWKKSCPNFDLWIEYPVVNPK